MDRAGRTWFEDMTPGSLHYVAGEVVHRIVNTGDVPIRVIACWPSDAGHDYEVPRRPWIRRRALLKIRALLSL